MAIELQHLHPSHDDEQTRLKARIAELEKLNHDLCERVTENDEIRLHWEEIEQTRAENEMMKARIAELEKENAELKEQYRDMDVTHTVHIAKMNALIEELEESQRWRKFSEEKPDEEQFVLAWLTEDGKRGFFLTSCFIGGKFLIGEDPHGCKPTYWMPLPSAPKEEK